MVNVTNDSNHEKFGLDINVKLNKNVPIATRSIVATGANGCLLIERTRPMEKVERE